MCTHDDISFFLCCVELRFSSDTGIAVISENNHVASTPSEYFCESKQYSKFENCGNPFVC